MSVLRSVGTRSTPQTEPILGKSMVKNSDGGYVFQIDDFARLSRFLVLGVDAGTYYASARKLATENAVVVQRCLYADPVRTVDLICEISSQGRAPKNDPAIFALALACAHPVAKSYALKRIGEVCRTGTHLFHFAEFIQNQRGWGRGLRKAVGSWYEGDADKLAYQLVKYRQRDGWTHRDMLRLAHPKAPTDAHEALFDFVCGRDTTEVPQIVEGYLKVKDADPAMASQLVREYKLPWEALSSEHLTKPETWEALLFSGSLPLGALVRNLGVMTARGVIAQGSDGTAEIVRRLSDVEAIGKARLHPVAILNAMLTYKVGRSKGDLTWTPVSAVIDALDSAFYASFGTIKPAGKRTMIALDVSGSMSYAALPNAAFNAMQGATAMAMATVASEPVSMAMAFSHQFVPVDISPRRRLDDTIRSLHGLGFGATNCSLPMLWALENKVEVDTIVVFTDNETNTGRMHPVQALRQYREKMGIDTRLVVAGMTSTGFSIADPQDRGMMDCVGFDTSAPQIISDFSAGLI